MLRKQLYSFKGSCTTVTGSWRTQFPPPRQAQNVYTVAGAKSCRPSGVQVLRIPRKTVLSWAFCLPTTGYPGW